MMPLRHGFAKTACVVAQLTALLLLQGYFLAPALLKLAKPAAVENTCYGNHRLCGCPPERIANKTCCCFRASHSCCHNVAEVESVAGTTREDGTVSLRNGPCGMYNGYDLFSSENQEFVVALPHPVTNTCSTLSSFPPFSGSLECRLVEPPDPPPRIFIRV